MVNVTVSVAFTIAWTLILTTISLSVCIIYEYNIYAYRCTCTTNPHPSTTEQIYLVSCFSNSICLDSALQEFKCEICGNHSYWGRRAFERHFKEWRHQHGMRCLGIPNTKNFNEITSIKVCLFSLFFFNCCFFSVFLDRTSNFRFFVTLLGLI